MTGEATASVSARQAVSMRNNIAVGIVYLSMISRCPGQDYRYTVGIEVRDLG